jgi:hypothetical protein
VWEGLLFLLCYDRCWRACILLYLEQVLEGLCEFEFYFYYGFGELIYLFRGAYCVYGSSYLYSDFLIVLWIWRKGNVIVEFSACTGCRAMYSLNLVLFD